MITINLNGRTLRPTALKISLWSKMVKQAMAYGELEEVKENKEQNQIDALLGKSEPIETHRRETSILEKLREELEKIVSQFDSLPFHYDGNAGYEQKGEEYMAKRILKFLTSLETKEEPVPPSDKGREQYIADWGVCPICGDREIASSFDRDAYNPGYDYSCSNGHSWSDKDGEVQPQFTPGQEIEVSDDGMDWVHGKFVDMYRGQYRVDNTSEDFPSMRTYWDNARHKEESPEIVVTEVKPSERIRQIADEKGIPNNEAVPAWIIASYLDEQALSRQKTTK